MFDAMMFVAIVFAAIVGVLSGLGGSGQFLAGLGRSGWIWVCLGGLGRF